MVKVLDVFPIGAMLSVTLEGPCENIHAGSRLLDQKDNEIVVDSVAMTDTHNPEDIRKSTTVLVKQCNLVKGTELFVS